MESVTKRDPASAHSNRRLVRATLRLMQQHADQSPPSLVALAEAQEVSTFRLLRAFRQEYGLSTMEVSRRLRMRRAAMQLAFRHGQPIAAIALSSGYDSHEAFTRAFQRMLGFSPSAFRRQPDWIAFHRALHIPELPERAPARTTGAGRHLTRSWSGMVSIVSLPITRTLALVHEPRAGGEPFEDSLRAFIAWRRTRGGLSPRTHTTWNAVFPPQSADREPTVAISVATSARLRPSDRKAGIEVLTIGGGLHARLRLEGPDRLLEPAISFLLHTWCAAHGVAPRHAPLLLRRVRLFPDVPEHLAVTDIHLPIHTRSS
jgi:AraC family transcriptional regulator